jgi:hypothetical protein
MATVTIEWAPFRLADGVDEESLLQASDAIQTGFLSKQKGFVRRELLKSVNGQWADLVYWDSEEAAARAMDQAAESATCLEYFKLMTGPDGADPGAGVLHFVTAKTYG